MSKRPDNILFVGATGSIGRLVVAEAIREGYAVRALVRDPDRADHLPAQVQRFVGDLTRPETLAAAVDGVDAIVFTHGSDGGGKVGAENIDYGGVRNVLEALGNRTVRIALMTAIGVTNRLGAYNRATEAHDWKRRGEGTQLRVLLLWLAWDLGEELTEQIGRIWEPEDLNARLRSNAAFLKLMPPISTDKAATAELEHSVARTVRPTPEAALRAQSWLARHLRFGQDWSNGFSQCEEIRIGGYCYVPGQINDPRVVLEVSPNDIGFWDYDQVRRFTRNRVAGVVSGQPSVIGEA